MATRLGYAHNVILALFIAEAAIRILAFAPRPLEYFRNPWHLFDFTVIVLALIPAVGVFALVARTARLLRMLRLISLLPGLKAIVTALTRSLPGMLNIVLVMTLLSYVFAIVGRELFHDTDPEHWADLGTSMLSLFRIVTLEDWTDIMYTAMDSHPLAWIYFLVYVVLGSFVTANLFVAVVISQLDVLRDRGTQRDGDAVPGSVVSDAALAAGLRSIERTITDLRLRAESAESAESPGANAGRS